MTACQTNPCGINAVCQERDNAGSCSCLPEYYGDPYIECRPECVMNSDCPKTKSCVNMKCVDPCVGVCSSNAECFVANHSPYCTCLSGYTGNPSVGCYPIPISTYFWAGFCCYFNGCYKFALIIYKWWVILMKMNLQKSKKSHKKCEHWTTFHF